MCTHVLLLPDRPAVHRTLHLPPMVFHYNELNCMWMAMQVQPISSSVAYIRQVTCPIHTDNATNAHAIQMLEAGIFGAGSTKEPHFWKQTRYVRGPAEMAKGRFDSGNICIFCRQDFYAANRDQRYA